MENKHQASGDNGNNNHPSHNRVINFFDKLEDKIRGRLSRHPITYALIGGVGIVLFWRGVWKVADMIPFLSGPTGDPLSLLIAIIILLATGLFVSFFVTNRIILSGLLKDKKLAEKTHDDVEKFEKDEASMLMEVLERLDRVEIMLSSSGTKLAKRYAKVRTKKITEEQGV